MNIAIRILVILLLFLTIGALVLEIKLFDQRDELKNRNQKLAEGIINFSRTIEEAGTNADLLAKDLRTLEIKPEQLKQYYQVGPDGKPLKDPSGKKISGGDGTLEATITDVLGKATLQLGRLNDTRVAYETEIGKVAATSAVLWKTEKDLADTKEVVKQQEITIKEQSDNIEKQKTEIATLGEKVQQAETKIEAQKTEIVQLSDKLADANLNLEATQKIVKKLKSQLEAAMGGGASNAVPPGLQGQVLVVNSNWNFVVLGILPESKLVCNTELMVQRDDKLIGKLRVSEVQVEHCFAVAEIVPDWAQMPVQKGDVVFR